MKGGVPAAQVLTANRLRDGAVVYRTAGGEWSTDIRAGEVAQEADAAARLAAAGATDAARQIVVAPYLIEVTATDGTATPTSYRERIRAFGPSIATGAAPPRALAE